MTKSELLEAMKYCIEQKGYSIIELCEYFVDEEEVKELLPEAHQVMVNILDQVDYLQSVVGWN